MINQSVIKKSNVRRFAFKLQIYENSSLNNLFTVKVYICRCLSLLQLCNIIRIYRDIDLAFGSIQAILQAMLLPRIAAAPADAVHRVGSVQKGQL